MGVCSYCMNKLRLTINDLTSSRFPVKKLNTLALWNWGERNDCTLRSLMMGLKGGNGFLELRKELVTWLVARSLWLQEEKKDGWVVIPAPPRQLGEKDHAVRLAELIGDALDVPVVESFRRENFGVVHHRLNRGERHRTVKANLQLLSPGKKFSHVIFVDDIVTTGATASRAHQLLDHPEHFQVWSLVRRLPSGNPC